MRINRFGYAIAVAALVSAAAVSRADTTITGEKLGAFFRITVPDNWNGTLVINNHGFDFNPPGPLTSAGALGPLAPLMLSEGYAVAASSYSQCCWTLFTTKQDINRSSKRSPTSSTDYCCNVQLRTRNAADTWQEPNTHRRRIHDSMFRRLTKYPFTL